MEVRIPLDRPGLINTPFEILILEDEPVLAKNMKSYLTRWGFAVYCAGSAMEATGLLKSRGIDLMFLDINLPDCDGLDFYDHIRQYFPELRVVVMSGKATDPQKQRTRQMEIAYFLTKPFPLVALREFLINDETVFSNKQQQRLNELPSTDTGLLANSGSRRIVVYCHDTFGLGNLRRMLSISTYLTENDPAISVLLLSGSPMLHAFRLGPRIDYIKLPCLARDIKGNKKVKFLDIGYSQALSLRSNLILQSILKFRPDLILIDKKPHGVSGELKPILKILKKQNRLPPCGLVLRDILDSEEKTIDVWRRKHYHNAIQRFYSRVIVVGDRNVFDLTQAYRFPPSTSEKVVFCGYLRREYRPDSRIRGNHAGKGKEPLRVLVTAGGGEDGFELFSNYLEGLGQTRYEHYTDLVCGPELSRAQRQQIQNIGSRLERINIIEFSDDLLTIMQDSDFVVSMGGYNTICEILSLNKPALIVPRVKPVAEQWIRAKHMEYLGLLQVLHPDQLTPRQLIQRVISALSTAREPNEHDFRINLCGQQNVLQLVQSLVRVPAQFNTGILGRQNFSSTNYFRR